MLNFKTKHVVLIGMFMLLVFASPGHARITRHSSNSRLKMRLHRTNFVNRNRNAFTRRNSNKSLRDSRFAQKLNDRLRGRDSGNRRRANNRLVRKRYITKARTDKFVDTDRKYLRDVQRNLRQRIRGNRR